MLMVRAGRERGREHRRWSGRRPRGSRNLKTDLAEELSTRITIREGNRTRKISAQQAALKRLLADIEAGRIDVVVVYKVDRLTRALSDFAKLVECQCVRSGTWC